MPSTHEPIFADKKIANFWSDKKLDLSFRQFVCNKKSVRVRRLSTIKRIGAT